MPGVSEADIHSRVLFHFPAFHADGWLYRGFTRSEDREGRHVLFRFEKRIRGRLAYAKVKVLERNVPDMIFPLSDVVTNRLRAVEIEMGKLVNAGRRAA